MTPPTQPSALTLYRHGQAVQYVLRLEKDLKELPWVYSVFQDLPDAQLQDLRRLDDEIHEALEHQILPLLDTLKKHIRSVLPDEPRP